MNEQETLLEFPCVFAIKAMGKNHSYFTSLVVEIIRQYVADIKTDAIKSRTSQGSKYSAVTVTIEATSKKQLDDIYQALTDCPQVLMAL